MAGDETTGTPPDGRDLQGARSEGTNGYGEREVALLEGIAAARAQRVARLAKELALETIAEVRQMVEESPDRFGDPERPIR